MSRLIGNISSDYFEASGKITGHDLVVVYVEGYDDISFWRNIFDDFETETRKFHISTPVRKDLAKGKKVVMQMVPKAGSNLLLCVDSDFDYIFGDFSEQSRIVNNTRYLFHTYVYAIENYMCYAESLRSLCVHATKNDEVIFDFEEFMTDFSRIIYPLFLWYALSARLNSQSMFTLSDFRNVIRIGYLNLTDNGQPTLDWISRNVDKRVAMLEKKGEKFIPELHRFEEQVLSKGVTRDNVYLFIQGHTLLECVVRPVLDSVCEKLRQRRMGIITSSIRRGVTLKNEISNYTNSLRDVDDLLRDNVGYKRSMMYARLKNDLDKILTGK